MSRYIDADKIIYSWQIDLDGQEHDGVTLQSIINKMPSIDAVKHGRWIKMSDADGLYYCCSECGEELYRSWSFDREFDIFPHKKSIEKTMYCPHCGARMDGR